jgi:hydrogenase nickel incorporation protein HypA/HybF
MHELSIAVSIVDIAQEEAANRELQVNAVHLRLGALSGVVKEALLTCYEIACMETPLQGSRLEIEEVPVVVYCSQCRAERSLDSVQWLGCPVCGTATGNILRGKELEVVSLEVQ